MISMQAIPSVDCSRELLDQAIEAQLMRRLESPAFLELLLENESPLETNVRDIVTPSRVEALTPLKGHRLEKLLEGSVQITLVKDEDPELSDWWEVGSPETTAPSPLDSSLSDAAWRVMTFSLSQFMKEISTATVGSQNMQNLLHVAEGGIVIRVKRAPETRFSFEIKEKPA